MYRLRMRSGYANTDQLGLASLSSKVTFTAEYILIVKNIKALTNIDICTIDVICTDIGKHLSKSTLAGNEEVAAEIS